MSTKDLARTVIEGGRGGSSRWIRRNSHSTDRALARQALTAACRNDDLDGLVIPHGDHHGTSFRDKLAPAARWLASQSGRPWDLVRAELFRRFDTRTTAGRHIVFCHLLDWAECGQASRRFLFDIDARGILRHEAWSRTGWSRVSLPCSCPGLERWLAGRRVGERGQALFWFVVTPSGAFRQERRLDEDDARFWRSLPAKVQEQNRPVSPPRS